MRFVLGGVLAALAIGFGPSADGREEKIDLKLLVGKWTAEDDDSGATVTMVFTKDKKLKITVKEKKGKDVVLDGTYKLDGAKLTVTFKANDKEFSETLTIVSLDDDELVTKDAKGKKETFERVEEKDK